MPLVHHELCFGCGRTNVFGLLLEAQHTGPEEVAGRFFIKQDHQGAEPATAHEGVLAAALSEAMALACGLQARATHLEVSLIGAADVGSFVEVHARVRARENGVAHAIASATLEDDRIAEARGTYRS